MTALALEETILTRLSAEIAAAAPRPHHTNLLAAIERYLTGYTFQLACTQEGWYRPGGVIRSNGSRVTNDLAAWAELELDRCQGDMGLFFDRHAQDELLVTRLVGKTHYFVAPYGSEPAEFLQLEVEELQEVLDRRLLDFETPPIDLAELIDPIKPHTVPFHTVSRPHYQLRQLDDMRLMMGRLTGPDEPEVPIQRFLQEWAASRAGVSNHFSAHWVIAWREYSNCYCQTVMTTVPVSRHSRKLRHFHWEADVHGLDLARQLAAFDRAAGYPFAWYFHLITGKLTPYDIATAVKQDLRAGYRYLAERDVAILEAWLEQPYTI